MIQQSTSTGNFFATLIRTILFFAFKVIAIIAAWSCKLTGQILLALGEYLENAIVKK